MPRKKAGRPKIYSKPSKATEVRITLDAADALKERGETPSRVFAEFIRVYETLSKDEIERIRRAARVCGVEPADLFVRAARNALSELFGNDISPAKSSCKGDSPGVASSSVAG